MITKKIIITIIMVLFLLQMISAVVIPIPTVMPVTIAMDNSPAQGQYSGISKTALKFAQENNCDLTFYSKMSVNKYECISSLEYSYFFSVNDKDEIYSLEKRFNIDFLILLLFLIMIIFLIVIIFYTISLFGRLGGGM